MQVLTPSGYKDPIALPDGSDLCAFDAETGAPIINQVEHIDRVDLTEWQRWWSIEAEAPSFAWYRINGSYMLFREQSIWRNGTNVCHARDLIIGDEIYSDTDAPITIASIEEVIDDSLVWYRFDVSGDHSYIIDGLTVHNASRFWVGGTGTWDSSTTTNWAASTGGAGGQSVPGSGDTVTLDASSGGGTVTVNFGGTVTIQSLTMGAFTGTFDNSVNNNNFSLSSSGQFNGSGTGVRTYKLGTATYSLTNASAAWTTATVTNLTYTGNTGATIAFTTGSGGRQFTGGALSHGTITISAISGSGIFTFNGATTIQGLTLTAPNFIVIQNNVTLTISSAFAFAGSSSSQIGIQSNSASGTATIAATAGSTADWCSFRDITFSTGSPTATNSFDLGHNSGATITAPSGGGGGSSPHFAATIF